MQDLETMEQNKQQIFDEIFGVKAENKVQYTKQKIFDDIFGVPAKPAEQPLTNEWGEPVYEFEKPVDVEGARVQDFLTPTIFEQKPNAKAEEAKQEKSSVAPTATTSESSGPLYPVAESGQADMPQSFISPRVFEEFTPEEKLMLDVDKATDSAFNAAQAEATKQMVTERKERGTFGVMDEFGEGVAEKIAYRQTAGADAVIKRTFESISADDINTLIENKVANNEEFKAKKQVFDDEVKRIMPNSNDNLSDAEIEALFANMTPEEREVAEKQIADTTQALEALQAQFATDVEGIYKSESKDVEAQINNRIINRLAKLNLPKNDLEYIGKAIYNNSLVGTLYEIGLNAAAGGSGTDYIVSQQALAQAKPSAIAKVVGGAGAILADGAIFGALGAGGSVAGAALRNKVASVVAGQIARKAAVSATNTAVKATARRIVEQNVLQQFASSAAAQAVTLGGYNGLLTAAQETLSPTGENGAYNWRNILTRFGEGLLTGVALGGVSVGTSAAKGAMYRARPDMAYTATGMAADLGVGLAGFTAENAAFLGIGSIVSGEDITAEAIGESFATLGLLKGIGALKRVAKDEKLMQQPDFVERTISDLKFTKEEMDAMRNAGVDMSQIDIVSEAVREVLNTPNKSQIAQETISSRPLMDVYNSVMASREVPISAKIKLQYIVNGTAPRIVGATSLTVSNTNGVPTVKAYDVNSRLVQVREFENMAEAESFVKKAQPLLERNSIIGGEKVLRGGQIAVTIQQAIEQYAKENPNTDARTLFTELMIDLGYVKGEVPASSRERVDAIKSRIKEQFVDPASQLVDGIARKYGTTVESVYRALNIKPDLRTVRESQLVKAYVDALKQFNESMSGPIEAEQARYNAQMQPQIEQGKQEIVDAQRETEFVRNSLNEAAKRMATADGKQIAIVRLENGEQVAVHTGRIVLREDGTIDHKASEQTIVIKRIDAEGNEQRDSVGIDDIAEVIEQGTPEEAVEASMSVLEAQATKKLSLDKALSENGEQGVEVVTIDGNSGKIVGIDENGAYILRTKVESGKEVDVPVSINDIEAINAEQPATTEQAAVADAVEKVVEDAATVPVEVVYDDDFPPLTEADMTPQLDADKIQWEKLSPEDYTSASAMLYGDATTLADSHIYHTNSRAKLAKAKQSVAEQQKVIDKLNSRFATLSSPAEAQKLRKQVAAAEQEKAKREQAVKNIEEQMAKYAHAMRKYGVEVATEDSLLAERARLEEERNALLEADKELDRYEQQEATKGKKAIANTAANRKYIEKLYADRFGVSPAQAGPRQAILWDLANGAIKLRWDNVTTDSGAVQKGLAAELGLSAAEKRIYKAVTDNKNGQSVDAYAHDLWQGAEWGQEVDDMTLKDMILDVLQSTPNGSIALKELADMSGMQADLEAQISLGKGDIQRKLEEIDANLAKNAQQMADFRKRINDTVQKLESGEPIIRDKDLQGNPLNADGTLKVEIISSIEEITDEDFVKPYRNIQLPEMPQKIKDVLGLEDKAVIIKKNILERNKGNHSDVLPSQSRDIIYNALYNTNLYGQTQKVRKPYNWVVLNVKDGFSNKLVLLEIDDKKNNAEIVHWHYIDNRGIEKLKRQADREGGQLLILPSEEEVGALSDLTINLSSGNKDTTTIPKNQISEEEFYGNTPLSEEVPFMIEQKQAEKAVSEAEQNFEREVFDAFAGHLGETLGAESVVTDAAEAKRVLEWHQAVGENLRTAVRENAEIVAERAEIERIAKDNGTWLKAPNGKDTNLNPRQWVDVRTSRFKAWFGDWESDPENASKVVDENGEPMVMYHGSSWKPLLEADGKAEFKMQEGALGKGAYFAREVAEAASYAKDALGNWNLSDADVDEGGYITEAFLNIRNEDQILRDDEYGGDLPVAYIAVAISPNQIKSATENTGEYSADNADIRFAIEAYHGSGADFEKFDHSFMSTGEGAQAFGWGTYVTEVENIARGYAKASGEVKERKERELAKQSLLIVRENIAKERMFVERKQKELVQMEEHYAKLEGDLEATVFPHNRKRLKETIQELANDIRNAKGEIESSLFQIEQLKPQEEQFAKVWAQFDAQRKIAEKEQHIEWNRLELVTLNRKLEKFENALDSLKHSGKMGDELVEDLIAMTNLRYELEGKDEMGAQEALIAEINRVKKIIEGTERGISIRQKEIEELQAIEQPKFRNLYSVEVPDNTGENYLPWDKDLTPEMKDKVYPQVEKAFATYLEDARNRPDAESIKSFIAGIENIFEKYVQGEERSGEQIYRDLRLVLRSDKAASEFLQSLGFTGIEYPAQYTTGGRADGAKNYVIFNADDVKIVDHVQYFKTPNGEVYGFVYEDKIYLDPTNIDPKAPVHEYTELWCREVAKANKPLWERGKELVKQTKVWEEVNADENYKNQSEDLRASEAWSRIIADEMMGKAREYGSKGLMAKLRGWLRSFWKTVKSVVGKWTKKDLDDLTVDQFKKMTMADFINKVDPRKWNAKKPKEVSKSLVGIHNISLDKLQKALKQGGLANPSAAVIDIAKGDHFDYGEYSFIMPKSLVDKKSGRNIGTFDRDAWTPLYPSVEYSHSKESRKNLNKLVEGLDENLADKIKRETLAKVNGNGFYSGLQIVFLKERGVEVPIASKAGKFFGTINEFKQLFGDKEPTYENCQALDKAQKDEVTLWIRAKGMPEEIARYKELLVKPARKEGLWNFLLDDVGFGKFDQTVLGLQADARNVGTPDYEKTIENAVNYIRENGLQEEFDAWQSETFNNLGFDERIQVGWSPSGERIMRKNTLENVSKYMRRQGKNASSDHWSNSEGKMLAQLSQNFSSLDKIRANKGRLRSAADDVVGIRKRINQAAQLFMNFGGNSDLFMEEQSALAYLEDILVGGMNPDKVVEEFNKVTKRNVTLTEEQKAELKQLREDMKNLPVQYFETKFERPVMFNEFAAVVAPNTIPESVEQQLRDAGLAIYKYNPDVEGDRRKATLAATASEDIRFMIIGEKGAANLDAMKEATTRLDNLAVAREMEEAFAEGYNVEKVNKQFNEELQRQIDGTLPKGHIYKMGMPSDILLACGFPDMPIELSATHLQKKASASHHPYELADVKNLVKALNNPLAVFEYGDKLKSQNAIVELVRNNKHFVVGVHFNQDRKGLIVSDIRGLYPKDNAEWLNWISQGKALLLDKNRIQDLIDKQQKNLAEVEYLDLDLVTKLIQDFENPTIKPQNFAQKIKLATGWERGADGKWRYEIGDAKIKDTKDVGGTVVVRYEDDMLWNSGKLGDIVDAPELFEAYPQLRDVRLDTDALPTEPNNGTYYPSTMSIKINADNIATLNSILNHEIQHAIQHIEGFASGSNLSVAKKEVEELSNKAAIWRFRNDIAAYMKEHPDTYPSQVQKKVMELYAMADGLIEERESLSKEDIEELEARGFFPFEDGRIKAFNLWSRGYDGEGYEYAYNLWRERKIPTAYERYKRTIGETEARNVQKRMRMTPEERRATLLSETEDVAREDQIFLERNLGVAQSVEVSEPVEAPTRKPRKSAAEKSLEKIDSLREQLQNKKRSLENTLADVYNFLTSKDIAETMAEGVGKAQYRSVIKNAIEAIGKAYNITDAEEKRKVVFRYLGEIDDNLSQLLTRQRLNEVTEILDKAIYGYTAQGVRTGKRIDEHTREIFDMLRNAIAEPVEEERDERGNRKPVHYRLKNRTEAGDITASFRLRTQSSNDAGVIAKLRSDADGIINSVDYLDTATTRKAAQLEYTANLLEKYDNTLQLNEAIGQSTDEIAQILDNIDRVREKYKAAAVGSEERKNLYGLLKQLKTDLESEKMNRANLRHHYASMLKTFTTSLEQLDEKGASEFVRAEQEKAEAAIKWRKGIYDSIKNPNAPVLPVSSKDRKGEEITVNWKGLNTRAKINESVFMATFAEMSRDIDINSIPGQWLPDGWYYQFMLAPGGYMERTDWRYKTQKALRDELDAKILKLSGDKKTDDPYKLFAALAQEPSGMTIQRKAVSTNKEGRVVGGYQENIPLTIGQLLYMRNTLRQPNGFAGYNAWGFSESYMQNIVEYVEEKYPQYCRFFDWVVSEFMPRLYDMQDAIYFKKFGTHLPKTAFYFPFVRDKRMVGKVAEVGEGEVSLPSSVTGNIVERVKTSAKMDLEADAFSVLQDHIKETLDWCAYVELTDKFNSVGTSHAFGNLLEAQGVSVKKLKEMYEVAVGQGKINSTDNTTLTKTLNAISKGLVAGNIVLNPNAAIKQIVSATATLGYSANPKLLAIWAKNFFVPSVIKTGIDKVVEQMKRGEIDPVEAIDWKVVGDNWKWAIENIPTLRERWEGREAGFEVLKSHSFDSWDKLTSMITNAGLAPNAFVDMLTCSNAAKTVYEYEYPRLLERGRSKKEAHREACVKAAIFINETQQSSLNGFLSSFQSGGGLQRILGVGLGAYQNSSMAFARNERFALANMLRMANFATRNDMQLRQVAAYKELGVEDAKAVELAKQDIRESYGQQVSGFVHNGVLNNYIWKIAGVLLGGLASAGFAAMFDKDEWNKLWKNEKFRQELASAVSAETLVWQTPLLYNAPITKQILEYSQNVSEGKAYGGIFEAPHSQSAQDLIDAIFKQWIGVKNEVTGERERKEPTRYDRSAEWLVASTLVKAGLGVNPDLVVRMAQGVDDMMKDGVQVEDVMATLASPRGLTRAIAGEPRQGESKEEYLNRMAYIYRQINAQDKKFVRERTKEYIDNKDNELYRALGIVPREERILEQRVKSIRKQLLLFDRSDEGIEEFRALPEADRKKQIEIAKRYDKITKLTKEMYQGILPFDEAGVSKRKQELQKRHDMMQEVYNMWIEYNNK